MPDRPVTISDMVAYCERFGYIVRAEWWTRRLSADGVGDSSNRTTDGVSGETSTSRDQKSYGAKATPQSAGTTAYGDGSAGEELEAVKRLRAMLDEIVRAAAPVAKELERVTIGGKGFTWSVVDGMLCHLAAVVEKAKKEMGYPTTESGASAMGNSEAGAETTSTATTKEPLAATESARTTSTRGDVHAHMPDSATPVTPPVTPTEADREMAMEWWYTPMAPPADEIDDLAFLIARVRGEERESIALRMFDLWPFHGPDSVRQAVRESR